MFNRDFFGNSRAGCLIEQYLWYVEDLENLPHTFCLKLVEKTDTSSAIHSWFSYFLQSKETDIHFESDQKKIQVGFFSLISENQLYK